MPEITDTSVPSGLDSPASPANGADDQKPNAALPADSPAPDADAQNPGTPEQQEERKQSRRARARERQIAETAALRTETRLLREQLAAKEQNRAAPQGRVEPKREDYGSLEDYYDARADYRTEVKVDQRLDADRQARQGREQQDRQAQGTAELAKTWDQREKEFSKVTKDYTDVVTPFLDEGLAELHPDTRRAIVEIGPEALYNLAALEENNPEEWGRIVKLSPARQIAELGRLEATHKTVRTSNAPPPAKPLGQGRSGTTDLSKMSDSEYKATRKAQGARWAQ